MCLEESPMEMWSLMYQLHPWQISSCSWKSTHLQLVALYHLKLGHVLRKKSLLTLIHPKWCPLFLVIHCKYISNSSVVVIASFYVLSPHPPSLDSWCSYRLLPEPCRLWGLWSKNVSSPVPGLFPPNYFQRWILGNHTELTTKEPDA